MSTSTRRPATSVPPFPYGPMPVDDEPPTVELDLLDLYPPALARLPKQLRRRPAGIRADLRGAVNSALTTAGVIGFSVVGWLTFRGGEFALALASQAIR